MAENEKLHPKEVQPAPAAGEGAGCSGELGLASSPGCNRPWHGNTTGISKVLLPRCWQAGLHPGRGGGASGASKGRAAPVLVVGNSPAEAVQSSGASQSRITPVLLDGPPSEKGPGRRGR